jgi:hypothetical protein
MRPWWFFDFWMDFTNKQFSYVQLKSKKKEENVLLYSLCGFIF